MHDPARDRQQVANREGPSVVRACERAELSGKRKAVSDDARLDVSVRSQADCARPIRAAGRQGSSSPRRQRAQPARDEADVELGEQTTTVVV